jgi:hypothetical protein
MLGRRPPRRGSGDTGGRPVTLEERVKQLIEDGVVAGSNGHATRGEAKHEEPTPGWGDNEDLARESDLAQLEAWIAGIEKAVVTLARAIDQLAARRV